MAPFIFPLVRLSKREPCQANSIVRLFERLFKALLRFFPRKEHWRIAVANSGWECYSHSQWVKKQGKALGVSW